MEFCNIEFKILEKRYLFEREVDGTKCIIPVNAQLIVLANENKRFFNFLNKHYCCFDGQIPLNYARKSHEGKIEKISGSDIVYDFCKFAKENKKKVFFLGGKKESNIGSVKKIKEIYDIDIDGFSPEYEPYPFSKKNIDSCKSKIESLSPHILFVGFGAPKQEYFIEDNLNYFKSIGIEYVICCGGTFEFVSGEIKRAPRWVQNCGLESVYRLLKEMSFMRVKRILISFGFKKYMRKHPAFLR